MPGGQTVRKPAFNRQPSGRFVVDVYRSATADDAPQRGTRRSGARTKPSGGTGSANNEHHTQQARARVRRLTPANPRTQRNPRAPSNECQPAPLDVDYDGGVERELACFEFGEIGDPTAMPQESQAHVGSFGSCRFPGSEGDNCMEGAGVWG
jgi:hypothetical protein